MPSPLSNDVEYTGICVFNSLMLINSIIITYAKLPWLNFSVCVCVGGGGGFNVVFVFEVYQFFFLLLFFFWGGGGVILFRG